MSLEGIKVVSEAPSDGLVTVVTVVPNVMRVLQLLLSLWSLPLRWDLLSLTQEAPADLTLGTDSVSYLCLPLGGGHAT